ncbi:MAG: VCBS repeat-containing protein, partial [Actinomycetota bacterium]|nr:VCBS repeat-containing protein [Actinomycetota bacterium]
MAKLGAARLGRWGIVGTVVVLVAAACSGSDTAGVAGGVVERDSTVVALAFQDVAEEVGLDFVHGAFRWEVSGDAVAMMGGGVCWIDFDRDGWLDLYVVNTYAEHEYAQWQEDGGLPTNHLYRNDGGRFVDVSEASGTDLVVRGNGCAVGDLDNDGWDDIYVTTARFNALLMNKGDGTFTEDAETAGADAYGWQAGAAMGDINGDGWLDLVMSGYVDLNNRHPDSIASFPSTHLGREDLLYLNQGSDGEMAFIEVASEVGLEPDDLEYGLGVLLSDVDRDRDLDLYVANDVGPNRLYLSEPAAGEAGFTLEEVGVAAGLDDSNSAMGIAGGDYDGDGAFDLFVTNHGHQLHSVFRNTSPSSGVAFADGFDVFGIPDLGTTLTGWGTSWADFDNDTDLDLFLVHGHVPVTDLATDGEPLQLVVNETAQGRP